MSDGIEGRQELEQVAVVNIVRRLATATSLVAEAIGALAYLVIRGRPLFEDEPFDRD